MLEYIVRWVRQALCDHSPTWMERRGKTVCWKCGKVFPDRSPAKK